MKLQVKCPECEQLLRAGKLSTKPNQEWATIDNSGWLEYICPKGHTTIFVLQNLKFDLLFETGAFALLDGYPREAVTSFSASIERYYEFHLTVLFLYRGMGIESFHEVWKHISKLSERQLGAYILCHAFEFGESPPILPKKPDYQKFRNDVIHNGLIPCEQEAIDFGEAVLKVIRASIIKLRSLEKSGDYFAKAYLVNMIRGCPDKFKNKKTVTTGLMTIASPVMAKPTDENLKDALGRLRLFRHSCLSVHDPKPKN